MEPFVNWREHRGRADEKFFKTTLWKTGQFMVGLNCLEKGQVQAVHSHAGSDKFYFVLEGMGRFQIGKEIRDVEAGTLVCAPAGVPHGIENAGDERLSVLVTMAPPPEK